MRLIAVLVFSALAASAQGPVEWAVGVGGRMRQLRDPVITAHALAQLGGLVCAQDPTAGAALYRDALGRISYLTPSSFTSTKRRLPAPSFTALWKSVSENAVKCSPGLADALDVGRAREKMQDERQLANETLRVAASRVEADPDRAAQLAEAAISASDPVLLDIERLARLLSRLRERAPDVSDDLFPVALDFIASAQAPRTDLLLELGKYLFTAPKYLDQPDSDQVSEIVTVGDTPIPNFAANRYSTNPLDVRDYIDAALKVLNAENTANYNLVTAYALAYQLLPKAGDVAPELSQRLRDTLNMLAAQPGAAAAQVRSVLPDAQLPDPQGGEAGRRLYRLTRRVLAAARQQQFEEARELLRSVGDVAVKGELKVLVDFAESADAIRRRDTEWAFTVANQLRGGVKRSLLYAGIAAASSNRDTALGYFQLGLKDLELLPAEQKMASLSALAGGIWRHDPTNGLMAINLLMAAANDAYANPHRGRFDPLVLRKTFSRNASTSSDSALILVNGRCACEVVDTGQGRHNFALRVAGVALASLSVLLRNTPGVAIERLEAAVEGLRDENQLAMAWLALADRQLR